MEVTIHSVYEFTFVIDMKEEEIPSPGSKDHKEAMENTATVLKRYTGADDVVCTSLKYFITGEGEDKSD